MNSVQANGSQPGCGGPGAGLERARRNLMMRNTQPPIVFRVILLHRLLSRLLSRLCLDFIFYLYLFYQSLNGCGMNQILNLLPSDL